ncbi:DUF1642 domain-containing protein [Lactococcus ileimucosae]|uniref:DUF1642 domain-containing protein n=1 Tax=Lactococcus ileimucosae TaxID=2941329 RepID=UPI00351122DA
MKKFEEELNYLIELSGKVLTGQIEAEEFEKHRVLFIKEQQAKIDELTEKNELYFENLCENVAVLKDAANKMRELSQENESLKVNVAKLKNEIDWLHGLLDDRNEEVSQTVKQLNEEIPEIPAFVAEWLEEERKAMRYNGLFDIIGNTTSEIHEWLEDISNHDLLAQAWLNGYIVKQRWFYLKSDKQLYDEGEEHGAFLDLYLDNNGDFVTDEINARKFTQAEIDSMDTGSYEQIEVEE